MELGEMATLTQTLSDEAIEVLAESFDKKVDMVGAAESPRTTIRSSRTPTRSWSTARR